jgi:hypothetical protein
LFVTKNRRSGGTGLGAAVQALGDDAFAAEASGGRYQIVHRRIERDRNPDRIANVG